MSSPDRPPDIPWTTAPAANIVDTAKPLTWRRFCQHRLWPYLPPLLFLGFNLFPLSGQATGPFLRRLGWVLLIGLAYVGTNPMLDAPLGDRIAYSLGFLLVMVSGWPLVGPATLQNALFANVMFCLLLPARIAIPLGAGWAGVLIVTGLRLPDQGILLFGVTGLAVTLAITAALRLARSEFLLARTRMELEQAILTAERERISRDVHDVLGHSLTTQIARRAHLAEGTVRNTLSTAMARLGAPTRADAVRAATEHGWIG